MKKRVIFASILGFCAGVCATLFVLCVLIFVGFALNAIPPHESRIRKERRTEYNNKFVKESDSVTATVIGAKEQIDSIVTPVVSETPLDVEDLPAMPENAAN